MKRRQIIYLFGLITFMSCGKKTCEETTGRSLELMIFNSANENVTNSYEMDSVFIEGNCFLPGFKSDIGRPIQHLDSLIRYSLGYCCTEEAIKYFISVNNPLIQNIKDSFLVELANFNECFGCSIGEAKFLRAENDFEDDGSVIKIKVFE